MRILQDSLNNLDRILFGYVRLLKDSLETPFRIQLNCLQEYKVVVFKDSVWENTRSFQNNVFGVY